MFKLQEARGESEGKPTDQNDPRRKAIPRLPALIGTALAATSRLGLGTGE